MDEQARRTLDSLEAFLGTRDLGEMTKKLDELQALVDQVRRELERREKPPAS